MSTLAISGLTDVIDRWSSYPRAENSNQAVEKVHKVLPHALFITQGVLENEHILSSTFSLLLVL